MNLHLIIIPLILTTYQLRGSLESSSGGVGLRSSHYRSAFSAGVGIAGRSASNHFRDRAGMPFYMNVFYLMPGIFEGEDIPVPLGLRGLWPNPSRGRIELLYGVHSGDRVIIQIFDISGRTVYRKGFVERTAGLKTFRLSKDLGSGIYILRFGIKDKFVSRKIVVIK